MVIKTVRSEGQAIVVTVLGEGEIVFLQIGIIGVMITLINS